MTSTPPREQCPVCGSWSEEPLHLRCRCRWLRCRRHTPNVGFDPATNAWYMLGGSDPDDPSG